MMLKFYGKISLSNQSRFGIKEWVLVVQFGYFTVKLTMGRIAKMIFYQIAQGSRVVMQMFQRFLNDTSLRRMLQYHIYFDNLFCCPDLLHLKKLNLRATGTVKKNRMEESHDIGEKAPKETSKVKYD